MYNVLRTRLADLIGLGAAEANADGGVALWDLPPAVSCANNPVVFTRTKYVFKIQGVGDSGVDYISVGDGNVLVRDTAVETCALDVCREDGTAETLTAESYGGVCKFDVSAVVRQWMDGDFAEMDSDMVADGSLYVRFTVNDIGGDGWAKTFLAVDAVAQVGESADMADHAGGVLTGFPRLFLYDGYALDYSVLCGEDAVVTARGTAEAMTVTRVRADNAFDVLGDSSDDYVGTEDSDYIVLQQPLDIAVIARCVPKNPFYVRWLNRLGGVDYFMFARQQKITRTVKSVSTYAPYSEDPSEARTNVRNYAITGERSVTVGAENVPEDVFDELERMPFSPRVEWWCEGLGKWIGLSVSSFSGECNTKDARGSFEATFALPTINTQY